MNTEKNTEWGCGIDIALEPIVKLLKKDAARCVGPNKICEIRINPVEFKIAWYRIDKEFDSLPLLPPNKTRGWGIGFEYLDYGTIKIRSRELILYERFKTTGKKAKPITKKDYY